MEGLCRIIMNQSEEVTKNRQLHCAVSHRSRCAECTCSVVCELHLSCKMVYIGQSGRINIWLREHLRSLLESYYCCLKERCQNCKKKKCAVARTSVLFYHSNHKRNIMEAYIRKRKEQTCSISNYFPWKKP